MQKMNYDKNYGNKMQEPLKKILIVGGGTSGWMTAAALVAALPKNVEIILIESEEIGTIGVGEATVPGIKLFNDHIGLNEADMIKDSKATFKLGIEFQGWGAENSNYFHGFSDYGPSYQGVMAHQFWRKSYEIDKSLKLEDFSITTQLAKQFKFFPPNPDTRSIMHNYNYAYHFDAGLYSLHLRKHCEARGVKRINAKINEVKLSPINGYIESVVLENNEIINADFFMDCSGFKGLLIQKALNTGYTDWSHWLPVNRAFAVPSERFEKIPPYTVSKAHSIGWQWCIPLQHRTGNGIVYSNSFCSDDEAKETLLKNLSNKALKDPMQVKFTTGHANKFWNKNCLAIGLASGFIEPLESTSINFIQNIVTRFLDFYPNKNFSETIIDEFNDMVLTDYKRVRDFIILHYKLNTRTDGELWKYTANMSVPDSLTQKIEIFKETGRISVWEKDLFQDHNWLAVLHGQGITPSSYDPLIDRIPENQILEISRKRKQDILSIIRQVPSHDDFIAQHCKSI